MYSALLEQPRRQLTVTTEGGNRGYGFGGVTFRAGTERVALLAFAQGSVQDGARPARADDRQQAFLQSKVALGRQSDLFFSLSGVDDNSGVSQASTQVFGLDTETPVILRRFILDRDPRQTIRFTDTEATLGIKHQWRPGAILTSSVRYDDIERVAERLGSPTSLCSGVDLTRFGAVSDGTTTNPFRSLDFQLQQATRIGRHQLIVGHQALRLDKGDRCTESIRLGAESLRLDSDESGRDVAYITYVRDEVQITNRLHVSLGADRQLLKFEDLTSMRRFDDDQWNPRLGFSARLSPTTVVRAAAFRQLNTYFVGTSIAPPTVSGFVIARNEFNTARRKEFNASLEHARSRAFVGVRGFVRHTTVPFLLAEGITLIPEADATGTGGSAYLNWIAARRVAVFGDMQLARVGADAFDRYDTVSRVGVNLIHPRGWFVRAVASHVLQRFVDTRLTDLPRSTFMLLDADVTYEFAGKRGLASVRATNALGQDFSSVLEGLTIDAFVPYRRVVASLRWRI
ncbi:MAG: TonB-dependent receptor domain-containing protein [Acidobacteriota bacterium]